MKGRQEWADLLVRQSFPQRISENILSLRNFLGWHASQPGYTIAEHVVGPTCQFGVGQQSKCSNVPASINRLARRKDRQWGMGQNASSSSRSNASRASSPHARHQRTNSATSTRRFPTSQL